MMCSIEGVSRERSSGSFACQLFSNARSEQIEAALKRMEVARPKRLLKLPIARHASGFPFRLLPVQRVQRLLVGVFPLNPPVVRASKHKVGSPAGRRERHRLHQTPTVAILDQVSRRQ